MKSELGLGLVCIIIGAIVGYNVGHNRALSWCEDFLFPKDATAEERSIIIDEHVDYLESGEWNLEAGDIQVPDFGDDSVNVGEYPSQEGNTIQDSRP